MNGCEGLAIEVAGESTVEDCAPSRHEEFVTRRKDKAMVSAFNCSPFMRVSLSQELPNLLR